jgi:hypothetical protein
MERRFLNAIITQSRAETGRAVTGIGNVGTGTIEEVLEAVGRSSRDYFGKDQMGVIKGMWQSWNNAWHEGPAYGAMLKHIGEVASKGKPITPQVFRDAVDISKTLAGDMNRVGASGYARLFKASVPYSAAMLQSWNSIGSAFKVSPVRFIAGAAALIGAPTVSEMFYNVMLSDASGTFQDPHNPRKQWTYNDYYWNGFTTQQRTDNFIYFVPEKPPWEAIVIPVSPEWGLFRATVMEGVDALFNLSDVGDIGTVDQAKVNRSAFVGAATRVFEVALPPPLAAIGSGLGMDVRLGLTSEVRDDPENPGRVTSIIRTIPITSGGRANRSTSKSRFAQGDLDRNFAGMIQDVFGAAGAAYVNVHEAVAAGIRGREGTLARGLKDGVEALSYSARQQARYVQPLMGKTLRPSVGEDEIARSLFVSRANLLRLRDQFTNGILGGGIVYADGRLIVGDGFKLADDPINAELAASASAILSSIGALDKDVSHLNKNLSTMGNATDLGTIEEKYAKMDSKTLQILALKAKQLSMIHDFELKANAYLQERYRRDFDIDLTSFTARADPTEGSTLKELLNSPRTSR